MNEWLCRFSQRTLLRIPVREMQNGRVKVERRGPIYFSCTMQMNWVSFKLKMWGNLVQRLGLQMFTAKGTKILQTVWQDKLKKKNCIKNWKWQIFCSDAHLVETFCYYQCFYSINMLILPFVSLRPKSSLFVWTDQCQFLWILWCLIKRVHFAGFMTIHSQLQNFYYL